jgi:hypothetical protein
MNELILIIKEHYTINLLLNFNRIKINNDFYCFLYYFYKYIEII